MKFERILWKMLQNCVRTFSTICAWVCIGLKSNVYYLEEFACSARKIILLPYEFSLFIYCLLICKHVAWLWIMNQVLLRYKFDCLARENWIWKIYLQIHYNRYKTYFKYRLEPRSEILQSKPNCRNRKTNSIEQLISSLRVSTINAIYSEEKIQFVFENE